MTDMSLNNLVSDIENHFIEGIQNGLLYNGFVSSIVTKYYKENKFLHFLWHLLHSLSYGYMLQCFDENDICILTEQQKKELVLFFEDIYSLVTGCNNKCNNHYTRYITEHSISLLSLLEQRKGLFYFYVDLHNDITQNYNKYSSKKKHLYSYDDVEKIYNNYDYILYFEKTYNFNILRDLLENQFTCEKYIEICKVIRLNIMNEKIDYKFIVT